MTALDNLARDLLNHVAAPLTHAVRIQQPAEALAAWRALTEQERETVVLLLAGMVDIHEEPEDALSWLTRPVMPEHSDVWTESPRPLIPVWSVT